VLNYFRLEDSATDMVPCTLRVGGSGYRRGSVLHLFYEDPDPESKTTKLILLDSLLQEVVATLPHLVLQRPRTAKMREAPTGARTPDI
jgi:hypothetical protein